MVLRNINSFNFKKNLNTLEKIKEFWVQPVYTAEDFLTRQIIKYCNGFGGSLVRGINSIYGKANPYNKLKNAKLYKQRLADVNIHNESYDTILNAYDSPDAFFFMDPPYKGTESLYEANRRGGFDFVKFRNDVARLEGKFLITINDDPELRELFRDFYIQPFIIKRKNRKGIGSKDRNEILISNYEF
jgi:site-specific DNA-adenine methylase